MYTSLKDLIDQHTVAWTKEEIADKIDIEQKKHDALRLMRAKYCQLGFDAKVVTIDSELTKERSKIIQLKSLLDTELEGLKIVDMPGFPYSNFSSNHNTINAFVLSEEKKTHLHKYGEFFYRETIDARLIAPIKVREFKGDVPEPVLDKVLNLQKNYDIKDFRVVVECNYSEWGSLHKRKIDPVFLCRWMCGIDYHYYKFTDYNRRSACKAPITKEEYEMWQKDSSKDKKDVKNTISENRDVETIDGVGKDSVYSEFELVLGEWY